MQIEWPNGTTDQVYSPSSVIREFFEEGEALSVADFEAQVTAALERASERVQEVYGMRCASAQKEAQRLQSVIQDVEEGTVRITEL